MVMHQALFPDPSGLAPLITTPCISFSTSPLPYLPSSISYRYFTGTTSSSSRRGNACASFSQLSASTSKFWWGRHSSDLLHLTLRNCTLRICTICICIYRIGCLWRTSHGSTYVLFKDKSRAVGRRSFVCLCQPYSDNCLAQNQVDM